MLSEGSAITSNDGASREKTAEDSLKRVDRLLEEASRSKLGDDDQVKRETPLQDTKSTMKPWQKFCSHCGKGLIPMSRFCDRCGIPIDVYRGST